MGQTVRQIMPFNANHAFMHASKSVLKPHKHPGFWHHDRNTPAQLAYGQPKKNYAMRLQSVFWPQLPLAHSGN